MILKNWTHARFFKKEQGVHLQNHKNRFGWCFWKLYTSIFLIFFPSWNLSKNLVWFWGLKWKRYYLCLLHTYKYSSFDYLFWNVAKLTIRTRHLFKISNISNLHWFQIKFSLHLGTWITVCGVNHDVYHVPKNVFCHEATVVITGRAHCFPYYININTYKIWHFKEIRKKSANTHLFNCFTP